MAYKDNVIEPTEYKFISHYELNGNNFYLRIEMFDTPCIVRVISMSLNKIK